MVYDEITQLMVQSYDNTEFIGTGYKKSMIGILYININASQIVSTSNVCNLGEMFDSEMSISVQVTLPSVENHKGYETFSA